MIELRRVRPEEYPEAVRLADSIFRSDGGKSMGLTYPMVFFPGYQQSLGVFDEGRLVSFIGLVPNVVRIGPAELRTHSLGAVCTHPDHRGKGYAGMILGRIIEHMRRTRSPLLLVSGGRSLYTRIGCREFGTFHCFPIDQDNAWQISPQSELTIRDMQPEDWLDLRTVSRTRDVRYEQGLWDLSTLIHADVPCSNTGLANQVLVAENEAEGGVCGFLVLGCSADPGHRRDAVAVEWAGEADVIAALLAAAVRRHNVGKVAVRVAWHEHELLAKLNAIPSRMEHNQGTALITDPQLLIRQIRPYLEWKNKAVSDRLSVTPMEDGRVLVALDKLAEAVPIEGFISLVFDGEFPPDFGNRLRDELESLFPIPFPYTGGINYV